MRIKKNWLKCKKLFDDLYAMIITCIHLKYVWISYSFKFINFKYLNLLYRTYNFFPFSNIFTIIRARRRKFMLIELSCYSNTFLPFSISLLTFLRLHIETGDVLSTWLPVTPLEVSWLELETVRLSKRPRGRERGREYRLFFMLKRPHAPRRPYGALFRQIGRKTSLLATYATDKSY